MPRQARIDAPGALHHIIGRGIKRRKIFRDNQDRNSFLARLEKIVTETHTGEVVIYSKTDTSPFFARKTPT